MLDSFKTKNILEGFRKRARVVPGFTKHKKQIEQAVDYMLEAHKGQFRKYSGRPFIHHPLKVAIRAYEQYHDPVLLIAGILHDTIEDGPNVKPKDIYDIFGQEIAFIIDAVSDNIMYFENNKELIFEDKVEKLLYGGMQDARCLIIKIFDRDHNLLGLDNNKINKQIKKGFETQAIYKPLKIIIGYEKSIYNRQINQKILQDFISNNKISSATILKDHLYDIAFANVSSELFELTKEDSHTIIREINDKDVFEDLLNLPNIDEKVEVLSMGSNRNGDFSVTFRYLLLELIDTKDKKLFLHGFNS